MTSFGSSLETKHLVKLAGSYEGTSEPSFALLRTSSSLHHAGIILRLPTRQIMLEVNRGGQVADELH